MRRLLVLIAVGLAVLTVVPGEALADSNSEAGKAGCMLYVPTPLGKLLCKSFWFGYDIGAKLAGG